MKKKISITVEITYDYVSFNGSNYDDVKDFIKRYHIYGNGTIDESFHIRPADILIDWEKKKHSKDIEKETRIKQTRYMPKKVEEYRIGEPFVHVTQERRLQSSSCLQ